MWRSWRGAASPGWRWSQPCTPSPTWKRPPAPSGPRWSGWWAHEDRGGHLRSGRDPHRLHVHLERGAQGSGPEVWRKAAGGPGPGHPGDGAAGSLGVHGGYILPPLYARTGDGRGERPGDRGIPGQGPHEDGGGHTAGAAGSPGGPLRHRHRQRGLSGTGRHGPSGAVEALPVRLQFPSVRA